MYSASSPEVWCHGSAVLQNVKAPATFNLADKSRTNQGLMNTILGNIFNIETGFHGKMISNLAKVLTPSHPPHQRCCTSLCWCVR